MYKNTHTTEIEQIGDLSEEKIGVRNKISMAVTGHKNVSLWVLTLGRETRLSEVDSVSAVFAESSYMPLWIQRHF